MLFFHALIIVAINFEQDSIFNFLMGNNNTIFCKRCLHAIMHSFIMSSYMLSLFCFVYYRIQCYTINEKLIDLKIIRLKTKNVHKPGLISNFSLTTTLSSILISRVCFPDLVGIKMTSKSFVFPCLFFSQAQVVSASIIEQVILSREIMKYKCIN